MKLRSTLALAVGVFWLGVGPQAAWGGWFGLGGSDKPADKNAASNSTSASSAKSSANSSTNSSSKGFFGLGGSSSNKTDTKKKNGLYAVKPAKPDKSSNTAWWNPFKPKAPPPPKTTDDWMKQKQVHAW